MMREIEIEGGAVLIAENLAARNIIHGFLGKPFDFSNGNREGSAALLKKHFKADNLVLGRQVHGTQLLDLPPDSGSEIIGEGDAIVVPIHTPGRTIIAGVRTADCVPLLLSAGGVAVVVHAGWRGLAAGILSKAVNRLRLETSGETVIAAIGPCAGCELYEVGNEVIAALGQDSVSTPTAPGKALLDLEGTAITQLRRADVAEIEAAGRCTIASSRYHSYRRESGRNGSNLAFVVTSPAA